MGVAHFLKEDDEFIYCEKYVHGDSDELPYFIFDDDGNYKYSEKIVEAIDFAAYEIRIPFRVRKSDATVIYDEITP